MSAWHAWVVCMAATVGLVLSTIGTACWGIWTGDVRGLVSLVLLVCCFPAVPMVWMWTEDKKPERPIRLSKKDRDRIRDEQRRIHVDAEIRRMEEEAGL